MEPWQVKQLKKKTGLQRKYPCSISAQALDNLSDYAK